ncbi:hybrid sensor histidine kinase/response regulator [Thalassotalea ponticola]|uniref:hybrid sensor histidine kinase/response regulator n=1 Tax=Thalassotalea ponticola TaxID=1523392 RepID=UPI0025B54265|nr:hybrid sensor histidine kinase/response regulator [Thalassotalea ponticola]MDN3652275.1 hybrid sensor histidine kinase/response regulator [Thalassotalea ponticola]
MTDADKPTILVVDDEPANIDLAAALLKDKYHVKAATHGKVAIKIAQSNPHISLILLDIMMPDMDGYQVCEQLKADAQTQAIPIIFLTARADIADITRGFHLGAVDYITKPLQPDVLQARVKTHITLRQSQLALENQVETLNENIRLREDIENLTKHDLKGPLGVVLFETAKLEDRAIAESIEESVNNVINMLNNTLDVFKIEQGRYPFSPDMVDLTRLVDKAIKSVSRLANKKAISFDVNTDRKPTYIDAEELLCLSIFNNLIKNAVEASPDHHSIQIDIIEQDEWVEFRIKNTGVIPTQLRPTLFDKYASSNHQRGSGLGAYSAKLMTEAQNGRIEFRIIDETFTEFRVQLPAYK